MSKPSKSGYHNGQRLAPLLSDTPFRHSDFVIPPSLDIRHSFKHVAPTELESLIDDEAINIALLTEASIDGKDRNLIENLTDETNYARWRMQPGSR